MITAPMVIFTMELEEIWGEMSMSPKEEEREKKMQKGVDNWGMI